MNPLFQQLIVPASELFYRRDDPNDRRLGEVVIPGVAGYDSAAVVILGCPQDLGVQRNRGRAGAAQGPTAIRRCFYRLGVAGMVDLPICDLGDVPVEGELEAIHALHRDVAAQIIADGKLLMSLGGGNDISLPDMAALAVAAPVPALAINIDAHYDVRADQPANSGTPYRQLIESGLIDPHRYWVIGAQLHANSPVYTAYLRERGATIVELSEARRAGVAATVRALLAASDAASIGWGFDLDVVQSAEAPGVSAPNPLGMSGDELVALAMVAGADPRTRLIEFSELNPQYDIDDRTARLAAVALWYALAAFAERRRA
ncbi:formimidoylglutamase [uncultured Chloroflexus sp.]|uniref:formimidoylglutamase n=1 Tax=uncultured Chloroflexus sp. TaxID=214040 RepID=UPI00260F1CA4|nr:formimidoylglutamase [uncultured Chloroflexus sp.]